MTKRTRMASGFVALFAIVGCSSDASSPGTGPTGTAGAAGSPVGTGGATGSAGAVASAGAGGGQASAGAPAGGAPAGGAPGAGAGGASGGSAGASGGAGGGSAGSAGAGGCPYKYCEDFEGAVAPGAATSDWKIDVDKTSMVDTVTGKAHGGTHSQHFKVGTTSVHGYVTETKSLALTGTSYWGRVWVWDEIMPTGSEHIVDIAIDGKSGNADEQVRIFNVINGNFAINRRSDDKGGVSNVKPMLGKWQCYEWHITPSSLDIYVDGAMLMNVSQTWANPVVSLFRMGFERFTNGNAGELWMDDLAMNDAQIGCK